MSEDGFFIKKAYTFSSFLYLFRKKGLQLTGTGLYYYIFPRPGVDAVFFTIFHLQT